MLKENDIPGILKLDVRFIDNISHYYYDISGKTSFKTLHEKINLNLDDMKRLVSDLLKAIQNLKRYMLDGTCILLEPDYIFQNQEEYFFCYYPSGNPDIREAFHRLTEFFVREVNYQDEEGVHFAYTLHKATMEENYSIEEIMKKMVSEEETSEEAAEEMPPVDYVERMEKIDFEDNMVREKDDMWEPIRRFLERSKRRKWGYGSEDL